MPKITQAEFSRKVGVSRAAITKARRSGRIVVDKGGKVNPDNPINLLFLSKSRQKKVTVSKQSKITASLADMPSGGDGKDNLYFLKLKSEIRLKIEQADTHLQRRAARMGLLVEKKLVDQYLAILGGEIKIRLLDLPRRIGPQIIALSESGKSQEAIQFLEAQIGEALKHIKAKVKNAKYN